MPSFLPFDRVAFLGLGLISGSLALALREHGLALETTGVGRGIANLEAGVRLGAIDRYTTDPLEGVRGADLVVVGTPVGSMAAVLERARGGLGAHTIVTDVGSVKSKVVETLEALVPDPSRFVGGHPIAGTEHSGMEHAFASLFQGAKCILTPTARTSPAALARVQGLWEAVGMEVFLMDTAAHDAALAAVSHLPHTVAYSLLNAVAGMEKHPGELTRYSGGGFRDFTRIGQSDPSMWRDICLMNREAVLATMDRFASTFARLRALVEARDGEGLFSEFSRAKSIREAIVEAGCRQKDR